MGLLNVLGQVGRAVVADIRRGAPPGASVERGASAAARAAVEVVTQRAAAAGVPDVVQGGKAGVLLGVTLATTAHRLRTGDADGAVAAFEEGAAATARAYRGGAR